MLKKYIQPALKVSECILNSAILSDSINPTASLNEETKTALGWDQWETQN
ncbi:MAG: hypothetical protein IJ470_06025 [Clostridia bacterium]|nr:hypothetical protein [Clostridia bacterium]